ncbi:MAG: pyridine nucleotide-disulfide oxidoreductase [Sphingomonadales bacterium RIFCSPHIGHO2_01_FULL_65_20]|jgi:3-phenylpropionate/trans-cinnamate dioxygenase ferredoxin reductase subunit|nr:MAG: pyridine nucleotide-disulfide oxidoreductase [Sphingomonadales bacterium RIFCSPHIGHO2_01_FULL_65_20]
MASSSAYDVVIVGAGHAGAQTAIALRQQKFEGSIALIGAEDEPPYERPPLSKDYFLGEKTFDRLLIRPDAFWGEREVALRLGRTVTGIDVGARSVQLDDGSSIDYGDLVWAAGARTRRLTCEGGDLSGVHYVRSRSDVDRLLADLPTASRAAVIGGGYIGLEAAAGLRKFGLEVTVFEASERPLARVAGPTISRFFKAAHERRGVKVVTETTIEALEGSEGRVRAVRAGGILFPVDIVIVGIGVTPEVEVLAEAGATIENGICIDAFGATSLPHVYAAGDCASHVSRFANGARVRLESVPNANDLAATVVASIMGAPRPHEATPWFWSNQFDLRLQTVGLFGGYDREVVRGNPDTEAFSVVYLREGRVIALDCVNAVKDYVQGRKLLESGALLDVARLADASTPLKDLAAPS